MKRKLGSQVVVFSLIDKIRVLLYTYSNGNVSKIYKDNTLVREYIYDQYDRLTWEKNYTANFEYSYVYDSNGNLTKKSRATKSSNNSTTSEITFMYGYNGDKMVSITTTFSDIPGVSSSQNFTYDALGNPTKHNGNTLEWQGRKLTKVGDTAMQYDYNGLRTRKGERYFYWLGNTLKMERWGENTIYYYYDESGISGFRYDDKEYYYHKNIFGDVLAIYNVNGNLQCTYDYDAWGNHKVYGHDGVMVADSVTGVIEGYEACLGNINPIRYRGYYWDAEFGLYYLQSRYYSPEIGRFISPDSVDYLEPQTIGGLNLYAYCSNNPVKYCDPSGHFAWLIFLGVVAISAIAGAIDGGVTAAMSGQNFWKGFAAGAIGGAIGGAMGFIVDTLLPGVGSFVGRAINTMTYNIANELFQTGRFDSSNLGLYVADTVMDVAFSTLYLDKVGNIASKLLETTVGGLIDSAVDIIQTGLYLSPQAQQRIHNKNSNNNQLSWNYNNKMVYSYF